jgi:glutamate synthase domain-containing protein 2
VSIVGVATVRQSRFGVKGFKPTPKGDIKTISEFELFVLAQKKARRYR